MASSFRAAALKPERLVVHLNSAQSPYAAKPISISLAATGSPVASDGLTTMFSHGKL